MDIEKLVEDGARAICRSGKFESGQGTCSLLCMESLGDVRKTGCGHSARLHGPLARAVLVVALRAAAEEVDRTNVAEAPGVLERADCPAVAGAAWAALEIEARLRTLAAQLGGDNA